METERNMRVVKETTNIKFDENFKTFSLLAGNSLYAFCISPELTLEHLYWGKKVHHGYDLRYLSQSCRMAHFNTVEAAPTAFEGKIVLEADTLEEIQQTWRENKIWKTSSEDDQDFIQKKRLENYSWRILSKALASPAAPATPEVRPRRKSLSVGFDLTSMTEAPKMSAEGKASTRRRSASNPAKLSFSGDENMSPTLESPALSGKVSEFMQLSAMAKFVQSADMMQQSSGRSLEGIVGSRGSSKRHTNKQTFERQLGKLGKGLLCAEYADHGTGDFRSPSFIVVDNYNGSSISPLKYKRHKIYRGKLPMPESMPAIRCKDESEASTLVVTMVDSGSGLEVDLIYGSCSSSHHFHNNCMKILLFTHLYSGYAQLRLRYQACDTSQ